MLKYIVMIAYISIFVTAFCGNVLSIAAVYRNRKLRMAVYILLANVSLADLLFASFSLIDGVYFLMDSWVFSEVFCRIQGAFMEVFYTVSILSLTAVALERYLSICYLTKGKRTIKFCFKWISSIWLVSLVICSPLFYAYSTTSISHEQEESLYMESEKLNSTLEKGGKVICTNNYWSPQSGIVFYSVHTTLIYILPLIVMVVTHSKIILKLYERKQPVKLFQKVNDETLFVSEKRTTNDVNRFSRQIFDIETMKFMKKRARNIKIIKLLVVLTTLFFVMWTPFIISRLLRYTNVDVPPMVWKAAQLLILASAAVNFFIYARMSAVLRKTFFSFFPCFNEYHVPNNPSVSSRSQVSGCIPENEPSDLVLSQS